MSAISENRMQAVDGSQTVGFTAVLQLSKKYIAIHSKSDSTITCLSKRLGSYSEAKETAQNAKAAENVLFNKTIVKLSKPIYSVGCFGEKWYPVKIFSDKTVRVDDFSANYNSISFGNTKLGSIIFAQQLAKEEKTIFVSELEVKESSTT